MFKYIDYNFLTKNNQNIQLPRYLVIFFFATPTGAQLSVYTQHFFLLSTSRFLTVSICSDSVGIFSRPEPASGFSIKIHSLNTPDEILMNFSFSPSPNPSNLHTSTELCLKTFNSPLLRLPSGFFYPIICQPRLCRF